MAKNTSLHHPNLFTSIKPFMHDYLDRALLLRSLKTALIIGTILALINHAQQLLSGQLSATWLVPTLLTYLVPFSVATYGQVQGKRQQQRSQLTTIPHPNAQAASTSHDALACKKQQENVSLRKNKHNT